MRASVLAATFAAGVVAGVVATRLWSGVQAPAPLADAVADMPRPPVEERAPPVSAPARTSVASASTRAVPSALPGVPAENLPPMGPPAAAMPGARYVPTPAPPADDGNAPANPIDVGDVFRAEITRPSTAQHPNPLGDAHRALERETRDDAWANARESELQNALLMDTTVGGFKAEHMECRATLCEVRLSAKGQQQSDALAAWGDGLMQQPWSRRMLLQYSSSIGKDGNTDRLVILRRPKGDG